MRRSLEATSTEAGQRIGGDSASADYTTRQHRASRWYQAHTEYGSNTQAVKNAQQAIAAAGNNDEAWQARQILAWRQLTTGNATSLRAQQRRHAKGTLKKQTQKQYLVEWQPNLMEPWEVQVWQQLGYKVQELTHVSHQDLAEKAEYAHHYDLLSCEVCNRADDEHQLMQCDCCCRLYHTHCISMVSDPADLDQWYCRQCSRQQNTQDSRCSKHLKTGDGALMTLDGSDLPMQQLVIVRWAPSWEPEANLAGTEALADWLNLQEQTEVLGNIAARPDSSCTNMEQQGIYGNNTYISHLQPEVRHKLHLEHQPINPYIDILPPAEHRIEIRTVPERCDKQNLQYTAACCYGPDGRCIGTISPARLQILKQQFDNTLASRTDLVASLQPTTFEQEVYRLLLRYKQGACIVGTKKRVDMKNHWTTPPPLMQIMQQHLGITKERFASPLNFNMHMEQYWSCHPRDQLFGASHDAFSCKWTGISECNPEYEHSDMYQAVAWAVMSAQATEAPVLTLCILPAWDESSDTAYCRWLRQAKHNCHQLLRIPRRCFKFMAPECGCAASTAVWHHDSYR